MADVIRKATNRFTKGLVMDFSPENTKNEVLTHALNATLLTFNGNELSLQNDMGNARVETAYLPEGYMPVGTCEYGGIIYIVSYNPLEDKSQIGCFPSPERNVSSDELGVSEVSIAASMFQGGKTKNDLFIPDGTIINTTRHVVLRNDNLNPGDKFLICSNKEIYNERLDDLFVNVDNTEYKAVEHPIIALNVVSIEDSGKIVYLNSDLKQYEVNNTWRGADDVPHDAVYKYHILGTGGVDSNGVLNQEAVDIDSYRNVLSSGYSVFKSKTSGKLAILAELVTIDSYSVTHEVRHHKNELEEIVDGSFDVIIHTEISPEVTTANYLEVPKVKYYYLEKSQGKLQINYGNTVDMFITNEDGDIIYNNDFNRTKLSAIYEPIIPDLLDLNQELSSVGQFYFPKAKTYHGRMEIYTGELSATTSSSVYTKFTEGKYHRINSNQLDWSNRRAYWTGELRATFYRYAEEGKSYQEWTEKTIDNSYSYYIKTTTYTYTDIKRDIQYKENTNLYSLSTKPKPASDSEINNIEIEKYQYVDIHTYRIATSEELADSSLTLYEYDETNNKYQSIAGTPESGKTYYILIKERALVSIGNIVDANQYKGQIYYFSDTKEYYPATSSELETYWDFETYPNECPVTLYLKESKDTYRIATENEINNYLDLNITLYYDSDYMKILPDEVIRYNTIFIVVPMDTYISSEVFVPNTTDNYILGYDKPSGEYPKDDPISLYTVSDFIPRNIISETESSIEYEEIKLSNIVMPSVVVNNSLDLPFKYDYTLVPCMNFGKLQHLAVSNTVDFSKLHAFNQSDFHTWKYHIDGDQLRLTFGADIFDTYEDVKVDGLVLEFYDLWGFAGSLEITDKKSYSGIFTKLIPLNTLNALSRKKVSGTLNEGYYSEKFTRSINIKEDKLEGKLDPDGTFSFNNDDIKFDEEYGWVTDISNPEKSVIPENDCGTLYSNILYGVKTYLKRTKNKGKENETIEFIKKKDYFLYTLPIYNDYYYTVNDFSTLENPEIQLALTYKLEDSSGRTLYTGDNIINGYNEMDTTNVNSYVGGFYKETTLDLTKFYKYTGISNLYLEVGLKKEYEDFNVSYSPFINNHFTCTLQLISDSDASRTYQVYSNSLDTSEEEILNYNNYNLTRDINHLGFTTDASSTEYQTLPVGSERFEYIQFITRQGTKPIPIYYEFVIGYNINISDIVTTEVPATTICALCHQNSDLEYNYEDFGVYVDQGRYLSSAMFYNGGTADEEEFGVIRLTDPNADTMTGQCTYVNKVNTPAINIVDAGKLNQGTPLKTLSSYIGKLTFCQPHAHGYSVDNGVNIYNSTPVTGYGVELGVSPHKGGWTINKISDDCWGTVPRDHLQNNPKYNLSLNTKNSTKYFGEFISTIDFDITTGHLWGYGKEDKKSEGPTETSTAYQMRKYTGFNAMQLMSFNEKLIETMKCVYAYNPDYDSLQVNAGNVYVNDKSVKFTSNLLSKDSNLLWKNGESLNNYIYLGNICFSAYLSYLTMYSKGLTKNIETTKTDEDGKVTPIEQVQLTPDFTYCGTSESSCLLSSLTYNLPKPSEIESELSFKSSNQIIVKHEDGSNEFLTGTPNKKALYGFDKDKHALIQLDVSNYTIDSSGKLTVKGTTAAGENDYSLYITSTNVDAAAYGATKFKLTFDGGELEDSEVEVQLRFNYDGGVRPYETGSSIGNNSIFLAKQRGEKGFTFSPNVIALRDASGKYEYEVKITSIEYQIEGKLLNSSKITLGTGYNNRYGLANQTYDRLHGLVSDQSNCGLQLLNSSGVGDKSPVCNYTYWVGMNGGENTSNNSSSHIITVGSTIIDHQGESSTMKTYTYEGNNPFIKIDLIGDGAIELYELKINKVNVHIKRKANYSSLNSSIISTKKTSDYYTFGSPTLNSKEQYKYYVKSDYSEACLRGTSLTINDLVYEPTEDHRLFVNCFLQSVSAHDDYDSWARNLVYYRAYDDQESWMDTIHKNVLCLFTGPSFTYDNL